ncbi:MAG: transitional endoplasmic reticulum ATPase [Frankiaceae bacterium]|jgi:transitional endoplasmic reticulum ATPase|nr:transitional endoplasmic reticulum ATPase [Frankiaceae bacterium]
MATAPRHPEVAQFRRHAAAVTGEDVLHPREKAAAAAALPRWRRGQQAKELEAAWADCERRAGAEASAAIDRTDEAAGWLEAALERVSGLRLTELLGKADDELLRVRNARSKLQLARDAAAQADFGEAGAAFDAAAKALLLAGGPLVLAVNAALGQAVLGREARAGLDANVATRKDARRRLDAMRKQGWPGALDELVELVALEAQGFELVADVLAAQGGRAARSPRRSSAAGGEAGVRVVNPRECETFADIGGLDDVKAALRATVGALLDQPGKAAKYRVVHNGVLFHGPPGTGKTLLSRAIAGEYGLRYIRFSPASIASAYIHQAAANLHKLFDLAREQAPCVLFLDEIDTIAGSRESEPSADHREVVTQLMNCLEEFRAVPGLVIVAATNEIDRLDPGLREGRFDSRILVPLPDAVARASIVRVLLERRDAAVDWTDVDVDEVARRTGGRNAAALESLVSQAAQRALADDSVIRQATLIAVLDDSAGRDRLVLDERIGWDDVVLADATRQRLSDIVNVFTRPDDARALGVAPPAGVLLYGPPGTGKTTIAKVLANEISASFYEMSAADLLSKWAGESEQKVAKLFTKARANRPTVVFIDEIDGLLRRRGSAGASPWEERVVSQFLGELDGLRGGEGVLLVGATNRLDIIDDAIVSRRLAPIEVGLPDEDGRRRILELLCRDVRLHKDVDLGAVTRDTKGLSGADLRSIRDAAGMRALGRAADRRSKGRPAITMADFEEGIDVVRGRVSLAQA